MVRAKLAYGYEVFSMRWREGYHIVLDLGDTILIVLCPRLELKI